MIIYLDYLIKLFLCNTSKSVLTFSTGGCLSYMLYPGNTTELYFIDFCILLFNSNVVVLYNHHLCLQCKVIWQQCISGSWPSSQLFPSPGKLFA